MQEYYFTQGSTILIFIILFASVISLYMSVYSFQRRQIPGAVELSFFLLSVSLYSFGSILEIVSESMSQTLIMFKFQYFWAILTAPTFLLIILRQLRRKKLPVPVYMLTFLPAFITVFVGYILGHFNLVHSAYWIEQGPYYPIFIYEEGPIGSAGLLYLILISLLAEVILLIRILKTRGRIRLQMLLLLIGGIIPTLNAAFISDRIARGMTTQPFALLALGIFIFVALFYTKMLDFVKLSRENAVDSFNDYLMILDQSKNILDINKSGSDSILLRDFKVGEPVSQNSELGKTLSNKISILDDAGKTINYDYEDLASHFEISISKTNLTSSRKSGYSIIFHEITEKKLLLNKLEQQALTDPLTGVNNRANWMVLAENELAKLSGTENSFVIMMLDIDHFKAVNDTYGHSFGDFILKEFCNVLRDTIRSDDILARYGGEEFCIYCSNTDLNIGMTVAERICRNVENHLFEYKGMKKNITVSIGLFESSDGKVSLLDDYLNKADKALYKAKSTGRNKVCY